MKFPIDSEQDEYQQARKILRLLLIAGAFALFCAALLVIAWWTHTM